MQTYTAEEITDLLPYLTPAEQAELDKILAAPEPIWQPLPGPQSLAYYSEADVVGFGGAAGGGKTDLAVGLSLTAHQKILFVREETTQLEGVHDRLTEILGSRDGYNGQKNIWRLLGRQIEMGSVPNAGDETKYQGRPHDLLVLDEATNIRKSAARFLMGWVRTTTPGQRQRALLTFNPPTTAEGRWVIDFFAPWLDKKHPNPAQPGELRYFATLDDRDLEVSDGRPFVFKDGAPCYDYDPKAYNPVDIVQPKSRTFIPSRITDNPYLVNTGYMSQLQAMPEPLRSQMLYGDFNAGVMDDPWQVIPTAWVELAMARWREPIKLPIMDSVGVDVARGGKDKTVLARRHGYWFNKPIRLPGKETPDGPSVAGAVVAAMRDGARIFIDVIGVGSSPYDVLNTAQLDVIGVNVSEKATTTSKSGNLRFFNMRAQLWWAMREALDPANNTGIALPDDPVLKADLCAPTWFMSGPLVQVESREAIVKRIGRSPDDGTAYVLALMDQPITPEKILHPQATNNARREYNPYAKR